MRQVWDQARKSNQVSWDKRQNKESVQPSTGVPATSLRWVTRAWAWKWPLGKAGEEVHKGQFLLQSCLSTAVRASRPGQKNTLGCGDALRDIVFWELWPSFIKPSDDARRKPHGLLCSVLLCTHCISLYLASLLTPATVKCGNTATKVRPSRLGTWKPQHCY